MRNMNAEQFRNIVTTLLTASGVAVRPVTGADRKKPILSQSVFLDLKRSTGKHAPDFIGRSDLLPYELKGPKEIHDVCHFSRAHLCSYLLQALYGQCLSYADIFRPCDGADLMATLIVSNDIQWRGGNGCRVAELFLKALECGQQLYLQQMELRNITFEAPDFTERDSSGLYGTIGENSAILLTRIRYTPTHTFLATS